MFSWIRDNLMPGPSTMEALQISPILGKCMGRILSYTRPINHYQVIDEKKKNESKKREKNKINEKKKRSKKE